ncbi:hypothetical protein ACH4SP_24905 [Streptomyces sp. NPDC021093]|uniref:hypothetical protein n=1 Tax=Streptomyces sp. NPDC021093 TaxID=3365112 RepID=UPI0037B1FE92
MSPRTSTFVRRLALPGTALLAALLVTGCQDTTKAPVRSASPSVPATASPTPTESATPTPTPTATATSTPTAIPTPSAATPKPPAPPAPPAPPLRLVEPPAPQRTHTPKPPKRTKAPAPDPAPASGAILSPSGRHYEAGQFCPKRLRGVSTVDANGTAITCQAAPGDRPRWH